MKKTPRRTLALSIETIRHLENHRLAAARGGIAGGSTALAFSCNGSCGCHD
jgi:hypothetical protein